ncbi:MAG: hypothetical protein EOO12_08740, partial [Chitinophagaceae bacterium]
MFYHPTNRPRTRHLNRPGIAWAFLLFLILSPATRLLAQTGTADGIYHFGSLSSTVTNGFKAQADKFLVSSNFTQVSTTRMYTTGGTANTPMSVVLKANNTVAKTFTLKNMSFQNGGPTEYSLSVFTITLKDFGGNVIATHSLGSNVSLNTSATGSKPTSVAMSSFPFTTAWPANGYDNVNSIEVTFQYATTTILPSNMDWVNWTLANISNTTPSGVSVGSISGSPFCAGATVSVPYTATGINAGNTYTAQLSDASGSFSSPTGIGTAAGNASSGTISAVIPAGTATGTGYRIRVVASDPALTSADNGSNLTINAKPSAAITAFTNISCFGGNNGSLTVTASGGTAGYTYSWSPSGGTGSTASNLSAGGYTVTVSDTKGCQATAAQTLTQPASALSASAAVTNVSCFGGSNASIDITASGGTSPYTYNWGSGVTSEDRSGLVAGTYGVTVTDNKGCQFTIFPINVTQPSAAVSGTTVVTNVACFNGNTGTINLTPTGGNGGYTFLWNNGATTEDRTALTAGTYSVTITDSKGCTGALNNITVSQPTSGVSGTTVVTNVACFGGNTGAINLTPTGGTPGYTFTWNGGATTEDRTSLTAGNYSVTITDANGCQGTVGTITVSQPTASVSGTTVVTNIACFGGNTGAINLTPAGGTGPYTFLWNNGATTEDRTGLNAGTYSVTITDNNGCQSTVSNISVSQPSAPLSASTVVTNIACFGGSTGAINLTPSGGTSPYTFLWNNGTTTTEDRTGLSAGTYSVTITDNNGCQATISNISVGQPSAAVSGSTIVTNPTCNGTTDGTIDLTPAGGTPGYTYIWGDGATTQDRTGLAAGTYSVTITDANGCQATISNITLTDPALPTVNAVASQVVCADHTTSAISFGGTAASYSWTNDNSSIGLPASGSGDIGSFTATNGGTTAIVATISVTPMNGACSGTATSFSITVNPAPSATIAYTATPYFTGSGTAAVTQSGTSGGTYSSTAGIVVDAATGTIDLAASTPGTYTVTYTVAAAGGCDLYTTTTTVNLLNPFSATIAYNGSPYCDATGIATVTRTGTTGGTYSASPAGLSINATSGDINLAASAPGTYTVRYGTTPTDFTTTQVAIRPSVFVNAQPNPVVCNGTTVGPILLTGAPGLTFSWTAANPNVGIPASGTGNIAAFTATNNGNTAIQSYVFVEANGGTGCSPHNMIFRITVNPTPVIGAVADQTLCAGNPTNAVNFT